MRTAHFSTLIVAFAALMTSLPAFGWGEKGHNAIAHIAQNHLTRRAQREVTRLLEGHNMAYWSSWADGLREDNRYDFISTWHYANADEGHTYATADKNPEGDVYTAVELCVEKLREKGLSDSLRSLHLKLLIHFVGDMHCPMHAGHASDRGGNGYAVNFRGRKTNLHSLWDSQFVDAAHAWSATEWAENVDVKLGRDARREIEAGTPLDWMEQTVVVSHSLYAGTPQNVSLSWDYINKYAPLVEEKFMEGGYRLAKLLNEIFSR
ncbi:MAG: S1/P1 nuclease [Alistipes sp.]|jgi:hypothetical protein|nr:S1/P1 nuclease [Alistipes sp.]